MKNCGKGKERSDEASQMKRARGSFTVEASLLMTIIIPVLVSLIYGSFYLHDCAVMQGAACELAAMASNLQGDPNRESLLQEKRRSCCRGVCWEPGKERFPSPSPTQKFRFPAKASFIFLVWSAIC